MSGNVIRLIKRKMIRAFFDERIFLLNGIGDGTCSDGNVNKGPRTGEKYSYSYRVRNIGGLSQTDAHAIGLVSAPVR